MIDLDIGLVRIRYSQDTLLKRRPQGEKSYYSVQNIYRVYHLITLTLMITRTVITNSLLLSRGVALSWAEIMADQHEKPRNA